MGAGRGQNSPTPFVDEKDEREKGRDKLPLSQEYWVKSTVQPLTQPPSSSGGGVDRGRGKVDR
jgi:hypothetical protein